MHRRWVLLLGVLGAFLALSFFASVASGSVSLPLGAVLSILAGGPGPEPGWVDIVWQLRLPKALTALLAGAALAVSGLEMQTLFRNPLAGPFVLGINSGASLGVALVVLTLGTGGSLLLGSLSVFGNLGMVAAAVVGALAVLGLVLLAARRVDTLTLLILGVLFGYAASAVVSVLLRFSLAERIQVYVEWGFGGFGGVSWNQLQVLAPLLVVGLLAAWLAVKPLNALLLGEAYAESMGLGVRRARLFLIASTALLAGSVTAFCGPIGFLGVAVPHLARGLFQTSDHRVLIPGVVLLGAILALLADLVAQVPGQVIVLPLNAVTALMGAPVIIWVILRRPLYRDSVVR